MNTYPFDSITVDGQEIKLDHILSNAATPLSAFEASLFLFIQQWFGPSDSFIQNTSGSTGTPKPIAITRQQMIASAQLTQEAIQLKAGETALVCLDTGYIGGKMMLVRSFVTGMKIIAVTPSANPFLVLPKDTVVNFMAVVPMQLYEIIRSEQNGRLNSVRNIIVGGAALNNATRKSISKFSSHVYATYGMTETVSHIALQLVNGTFASEYFKVLPGIKINTDDRGCLLIDVPYLNEKIITHDLVEIKDDTHFKWLGRVDNVINTGGIKVIPEKIEAEIGLLFAQQKIENKFLISGLPDVTLGYKIILLIEGEVPISTETLKSCLKQTLPSYEIPKEIYLNIDFVLTKNGKINRSETLLQLGNG